MSTKFQTLCRKPRLIRLNNSSESYDSKLRYPSFWDTLYSMHLHKLIFVERLMNDGNFAGGYRSISYRIKYFTLNKKTIKMALLFYRKD